MLVGIAARWRREPGTRRQRHRPPRAGWPVNCSTNGGGGRLPKAGVPAT